MECTEMILLIKQWILHCLSYLYLSWYRIPSYGSDNYHAVMSYYIDFLFPLTATSNSFPWYCSLQLPKCSCYLGICSTFSSYFYNPSPSIKFHRVRFLPQSKLTNSTQQTPLSVISVSVNGHHQIPHQRLFSNFLFLSLSLFFNQALPILFSE